MCLTGYMHCFASVKFLLWFPLAGRGNVSVTKAFCWSAQEWRLPHHLKKFSARYNSDTSPFQYRFRGYSVADFSSCALSLLGRKGLVSLMFLKGYILGYALLPSNNVAQRFLKSFFRRVWRFLGLWRPVLLWKDLGALGIAWFTFA